MPALITPIRKRAHFEAARKSGREAATAGFIVQALPMEEVPGMLVGYTVSRKVGNAVMRNRVKRRLRALVRLLLPERGKPQTAYVFIGRKAAIDRPYEKLEADFKFAFHSLNGTARDRQKT